VAEKPGGDVAAQIARLYPVENPIDPDPNEEMRSMWLTPDGLAYRIPDKERHLKSAKRLVGEHAEGNPITEVLKTGVVRLVAVDGAMSAEVETGNRVTQAQWNVISRFARHVGGGAVDFDVLNRETGRRMTSGDTLADLKRSLRIEQIEQVGKSLRLGIRSKWKTSAARNAGTVTSGMGKTTRA
jgi:hypothetical protein